ncbi:MAG: hypothetical protein JSS66_06145 [Armatimonadetes bacterium]|nr:hypothetical protein [Armatimonadota bacterium]
MHTSFCDLLLSKVKPWTTCTARRDPSKIATGDLVSLHFYSLGVRYHVYKAPEATVPLEGDLAHCPKGWSLTSVRHVHMTPKYPGHPFDPTEFLGGCQECQMWCDDGRHVWILAKAVAYPDDQHVLCHLVFYCFVRKEGTGSLLDSVVT